MSFENTSDVVITKNGTSDKPLTKRKGKCLMTYNKKQKKTNEKSDNSETDRRYCCLEGNKKEE